ncbi:MAG: M20 family metallopeptidase [Armatimonadota bacterium]
MDDRMRERIVSSIARQEVIDLECSLVAIPSYTTEETELAKFIGGQMNAFGLDATLQEVPLAEGVSHNVIGRLRGSGGGPSMLLFGHMDHGPIMGRKFQSFEGWKRDPFKPSIEGEWIYGKGCQDEKGGLCGLITAAKAMVRAGFKPKGDIYFCPVQGHKRLSSGILYLLKSGLRTAYAVNTENSGLGIVPLWVGRSEGTVHVRAAHASELHFHPKEQLPELRPRKTAFEYLTRFLQALGPEMIPPGPDTWLTFTRKPGLEDYPQHRVETITFRGLDHLEFNFQLRLVPGQNDETIRADLQRLVKKLQAEDPHFRAEVVWPFQPTRPAGNTPFDSPLVEAFAAAQTHVTGRPADVSAKGRLGAAADGSLVFGAGIPTILYGPGGGMTDLEHARAVWNKQVEPDERIRIDDIVVAATVFALATAELCG